MLSYSVDYDKESKMSNTTEYEFGLCFTCKRVGNIEKLDVDKINSNYLRCANGHVFKKSDFH